MVAVPSQIDLVPVRGLFASLDGSPLDGEVTFTASVPHLVVGAAKTVVINRAIKARVKAGVLYDPSGIGPLSLYATDDPDTAPNGWYYTVAEKLTGGAGRPPYRLQVPVSAKASGLDLYEVAPVPPTDANTYSYVVLSAFSELRAQVENLAENGAGMNPGQVLDVIQEASALDLPSGSKAGGSEILTRALGVVTGVDGDGRIVLTFPNGDVRRSPDVWPLVSGGDGGGGSAGADWATTVVHRWTAPFASRDTASPAVGSLSLHGSYMGNDDFERSAIVNGLYRRGTISSLDGTLPVPMDLTPGNGLTTASLLMKDIFTEGVNDGRRAMLLVIGDFHGRLFRFTVSREAGGEVRFNWTRNGGGAGDASGFSVITQHVTDGLVQTGSFQLQGLTGWHLFTFVFNGDQTAVYLNGVATPIVSNIPLGDGGIVADYFGISSDWGSDNTSRGGFFLRDALITNGTTTAQLSRMRADLLASTGG